MKDQVKKFFHSELLKQDGICLSNAGELFPSLKQFHFSKSDLVYYHIYSEQITNYITGINDFLGYKDKTLTIEQQFEMVHPDDLPDLFKAIQNAFERVPKSNIDHHNTFSKFTYRIKHKKGHYINVLREAKPLIIQNGKLGAHIDKVTDISYLNIPKRVNAWGGVNNLTFPLLEKKHQNIFTKREKQILYLLTYGKTSAEIAILLNVEKNTVDKHRQNMLKKAAVENTMQLVTFSIEHDIIRLPLEYKIPKFD